MLKTAEPMTSGSILKRMSFFALPLLLGNLFQQLYNTVDSLIVGNLLGSSAIDGMDIPSLVGTVAGDDTVFMAMRDVKSAEAFREEIRKLF